MTRATLLVLLAVATPAQAAELSVLDYRPLVGDSATTLRQGFAAAIAAASPGDVVRLPDGDYTINVLSLRSVLVNKGVSIRGDSREGTVLRIDPSLTGGSATWRMFEITASNVTIADLTLEGSKPGSNTATAYDPLVEHHSGIFVGPGPLADFTLRNVAIRNFQGDGVQIYSAVTRPVIEDSSFEFCQRSGLSYTPPDGTVPVIDAIVRRTVFTGITAQPIDNEHGPVYGAEISYNTFNVAFNNYALTMSGYALASVEETPTFNNRSKNWHVHHNYFTGGIFVIRASDGLFERNTFRNVTTKPDFEVSRSANNITFRLNDSLVTGNTTNTTAAVFVNGTGNEQRCRDANNVFVRCDAPGAILVETWQAFPSGIVISDNNITMSVATAAIRSNSSDSVVIEDNDLTGPGVGVTGVAGIFGRATTLARDFGSLTIRGNRIRGYARGIGLAGGSGARIATALVEGNLCENPTAGGPLSVCVHLNTDSANALQAGTVRGNVAGCGVTTNVTGIPAAASMVLSPLAISAGCAN